MSYCAVCDGACELEELREKLTPPLNEVGDRWPEYRDGLLRAIERLEVLHAG